MALFSQGLSAPLDHYVLPRYLSTKDFSLLPGHGMDDFRLGEMMRAVNVRISPHPGPYRACSYTCRLHTTVGYAAGTLRCTFLFDVCRRCTLFRMRIVPGAVACCLFFGRRLCFSVQSHYFLWSVTFWTSCCHRCLTFSLLAHDIWFYRVSYTSWT